MKHFLTESDFDQNEIIEVFENRANDWRNEWAYWNKVEIVKE